MGRGCYHLFYRHVAFTTFYQFLTTTSQRSKIKKYSSNLQMKKKSKSFD